MGTNFFAGTGGDGMKDLPGWVGMEVKLYRNMWGWE